MTTPTIEARVQAVTDTRIKELEALVETLQGRLATERARVDRHRAASATQVPQGWKLVPVEPTEEMLNAGISARRDMGATEDVFAAMVAASPPTPQAATQGEAVRWEYQLRNPGFATAVGMSWTECSKQRYEELKGMDRYEVRALAVINEPAPAPSKEQTP